jgi:predicted nucleotidyltransferase
MAKIPKRPEEIFDELRGDYTALFGDDLLAIILYGSGARGEYVPKRSDLNFLILLSDNGIERLGEAIEVVAKWQKRSIPVPLFLTRGYIESSLDTFPLEFFNIQSAYQVIYGEDIFKDLLIESQDLRLQCERELKAKLLLLRESFLQAHGKTRPLRELINQSLPAFISIFKALLYLKGGRIPETHEALIPAIAENFGLDGGLLRTLWQIKTGEKKPGEQEMKKLVINYISEIKGLSKQVDQMVTTIN